MSRPLKKSQKALIGVLIAVVLIGACFTTVTLYAKRELSKPRFTMPEMAAAPSAPLPTEDDALRAHVGRLYAETTGADDVEGSWSTDISMDGEWNTPLPDADEAVLRYIASQAGGQIAALYPSAENVLLHKTADIPQPILTRPDMTADCTAREGNVAENGSVTDTDRVFITMKKELPDPAAEPAAQNSICRTVTENLRALVQITDVTAAMQSATETYTTDRVTGALLQAELIRTYRIRATVLPTQETKDLLPADPVQIELPYTAKAVIRFAHYGARFSSPAIVVHPGDEKTLPAEVTVNAEAAASDYTLRFSCDAPDALSFAEDGVMYVHKAVPDPVTVTMTLEYDGHTYTDRMTVYITELEVAPDA